MIPLLFHYNDSFWDVAIVKWIFAQIPEVTIVQGPAAVYPNSDVGVIFVPGRHSLGDYHFLNAWAKTAFKKVIWCLGGDEEGKFQANALVHPNQKIWYFMPPFNPKQQVDRVCVNGWPTDAPEMIERERQQLLGRDRLFPISFAGQMTHVRRVEAVAAMQNIPDAVVLPTAGFTQGIPRPEYYKTMVLSKLVACPSGPCTPDSFRFAEALEAGCIPVVDDCTPDRNYPKGYFSYALSDDDLPFPVIENWAKLPKICEEWFLDWDRKAARCQRWWMSKKNQWVNEMREDLGL